MLETVESTIHEAEKIAENETVATNQGLIILKVMILY